MRWMWWVVEVAVWLLAACLLLLSAVSWHAWEGGLGVVVVIWMIVWGGQPWRRSTEDAWRGRDE